MRKKDRNNPKLPKLGNLLTWGVLGVAAYGGYRAYQAVRGNAVTPATDEERCIAAGGIWIAAPSLRFDPANPAPGYCEIPRIRIRKQ